MAPERNAKSVPNGLQDTVVHHASRPDPPSPKATGICPILTELAVLDPINAVA